MLDSFVSGGPRMLLRIEGLAYAALAVIGYAQSGYSWWAFAALILVPDLGMLGYFINAQIGAVTYNLVHTLILPIALLLGALLFANTLLLALGAVWLTAYRNRSRAWLWAQIRDEFSRHTSRSFGRTGSTNEQLAFTRMSPVGPARCLGV